MGGFGIWDIVNNFYDETDFYKENKLLNMENSSSNIRKKMNEAWYLGIVQIVTT
jgi:hypothetical protein